MIRLLSIIIVVNIFFSPYRLEGQSCLTEGIFLNSQEAIDSFPMKYPGCTHILGSVNISGYKDADITNLNGLSNIRSIQNSLSLSSLTSLTDLQGLYNLTYVGEHISVTGCNLFQNLKGLDNLEFVGGDLHIYNNKSLRNLEGLDNLINVKKNVSLHRNHAMQNLKGLEGLTSIDGSLAITENKNLFDLSGLDNLNKIGKEFTVCSNEALTHFNNPKKLLKHKHELGICKNPNLISISGLKNLLEVGSLGIAKNDKLTHLDGLTNLTIVHEFFDISENESLKSLKNLSSLKSVGGMTIIWGNPSLKNMDGLSNLEFLGETLFIFQNTTLENLDGMRNLKTINGEIYIVGNANLHSIEGLENVDPSSVYDIGGDDMQTIEIRDNPLLSVCSIESICHALNVYNKSHDIKNNGIGCESRVAISSSCLNHVVTLSPLRAKYEDGHVKLEWTVTEQTNNKSFLIEYSKDGISFELLGSIEGEAFYPSEKKYNYNHCCPISGYNYYRIGYEDYSDTKQYSNVTTLKIVESMPEHHLIHQLVVSDFLFIKNAEYHNVAIFNELGQLIKKVTTNGDSVIDIQGFSPGMYYLMTKEGRAERFIKL